jgi:hypothetical protein
VKYNSDEWLAARERSLCLSMLAKALSSSSSDQPLARMARNKLFEPRLIPMIGQYI